MLKYARPFMFCGNMLMNVYRIMTQGENNIIIGKLFRWYLLRYMKTLLSIL